MRGTTKLSALGIGVLSAAACFLMWGRSLGLSLYRTGLEVMILAVLFMIVLFCAQAIRMLCAAHREGKDRRLLISQAYRAWKRGLRVNSATRRRVTPRWSRSWATVASACSSRYCVTRARASA